MTDQIDFDAIFFIGPQGSGKGTQAKLLAEKTGFFYWEMGQIFRDIAKSGTELGNQIGSLIDQGVLLGDDLWLQVVKQKLSELPATKGVIFDGVTRRLGQAQFLLDNLRLLHYKNFATIFITLPKEESIKRLLLRAKIEGRKDDTKEAIEFRLQQYEHDTVPVLDYLKESTEFITINGLPPIDEVTDQINKSLESIKVPNNA